MTQTPTVLEVLRCPDGKFRIVFTTGPARDMPFGPRCLRGEPWILGDQFAWKEEDDAWHGVLQAHLYMQEVWR